MNATRFRRRLRWQRLLVILAAVSICALTTRAALRYTGIVKPPRPMYCNVYGYHHRGQMMPAWGPSMRLYDAVGFTGWADFSGDAVLICVFAPDELSGSPMIFPDVDTTKVVLEVSDRAVTVRRKQDVLVLVRRDGRVGEFAIESGAAEPLFDRCVFQNNTVCPSLIGSARAIFQKESQTDMDSFLGIDNID